MSVACQRRVCRAQNAFRPGQALLALIGFHPTACRRAYTAVAEVPEPPARGSDGSDVKRARSVRSSKRPLPPARYGGKALDDGVLPAAQTASAQRSRRQSGLTSARSDRLEEPSKTRKSQRSSHAPLPTASKSATTVHNSYAHQRLIFQPNPPNVEYDGEKQWQVLSDVDRSERLARIALLLQWVRQERKANNVPEKAGELRQRLGSPELGVTALETAKCRSGAVLEYQAQVVCPNVPRKSDELVPPWLQVPEGSEEEKLLALSSSERLNWEIEGFVDSILPNELECKARQAVDEDIRAAVAQVLPDAELENFGSQKTGLALATSDLDYRLLPPEHDQDEDTKAHMAPRQRTRKRMTRILSLLHKVLDRHPKFMLAQLRHARYPLISLQHKESGIDIQIVGSNDTTHQRAFVTKYLQEYPALKDVYITVKTIFDVRGFCDVFRGGISSYGVFMMLVAALKMQQSRGGVVKVDEPPNLLQHFLQFWAEHDTYTHGVKIEPAVLFEKLAPTRHDAEIVHSSHTADEDAHIVGSTTKPGPAGSAPLSTNPEVVPLDDQHTITKGGKKRNDHIVGALNPQEPYLLSLIDPADLGNDLGRKVFGIKHILATLRQLHIGLVEGMWDIDTIRLGDVLLAKRESWFALVRQHASGRSPETFPDVNVVGRHAESRLHGMRKKPLLNQAVGASHHMYRGRREKMQAFAKERLAEATSIEPSTSRAASATETGQHSKG